MCHGTIAMTTALLPTNHTLLHLVDDEELTKVEQIQSPRKLLRRVLTDFTCAESETEDEEEPSDSEEESEEEDDDIQLITTSKFSTTSLSSSRLNFGPQLQEAMSNPARTSLVLTNFVERSSRHDIYALRDLLLQDDRQWSQVRIEDDHCPNFRRWAYKKENVNHHIQQVCLDRKIPLEYHATMDVNVDDISLEGTLTMLAEIKKHPEVRHLNILGHMNAPQEERLLTAVTSLLRLEDRDWDAVNVFTGFAQGQQDDYEAWRSVMERYMGVFSNLYTQYNIPIDIRPCA